MKELTKKLTKEDLLKIGLYFDKRIDNLKLLIVGALFWILAYVGDFSFWSILLFIGGCILVIRTGIFEDKNIKGNKK